MFSNTRKRLRHHVEAKHWLKQKFSTIFKILFSKITQNRPEQKYAKKGRQKGRAVRPFVDEAVFAYFCSGLFRLFSELFLKIAQNRAQQQKG